MLSQLDLLDRRVDQLLVPHVEVTRCLVEQKEPWVLVERSRKEDALLLPAGQARSDIADQRVVGP